MALTTQFDGATLPDGWSAFTPPGSSVTVAGGWLQLTAAGGTPYDGISANNGVNGGIGAYHALPDPGGPFSIAAQVSTDVGDTRSWGAYLAVCDVDGEDNSGGGWVRYGISRPNSTAERPNRFAGSRPAGSGTGTGGTNHYNTHVNNPPMALQSGMPAYLRLDFDGVQTFQPYLSTDGVTWLPDTPITRAIDPTRVMVLFTSTTPNTAGTFRFAAVWDLLAYGDTDLRRPAPAVERVPVSSFDGTTMALPAGWVDDSAGGDSITFTGSAVRLSSDAANVDSRARLLWSGARHRSCGLLLRVHWPSFSSSLFNTWGLLSDGAVDGDPYLTSAGGYGIERGATQVRPIRSDNPTDSNVGSSPGTTGLDELRYAWLLDTTGTNLAVGAPTLMFRLERQYVADGGHARYRVRSWPDAGSLAASLAAEPTTWDIIDAQDDIERDGLGPLLVLAHNNPVGGLTGTGQADLLHVEFYALVEQAAAVLDVGAAELAAAATTEAPVAEASAALQLGAATLTATATTEVPVANASATLPLGAFDLAAAATTEPPIGVATATLDLGAATLTAAATADVPVAEAAAVLAVGPLTLVASALPRLEPSIVAVAPLAPAWAAEPLRSAVSASIVASAASVEQYRHRIAAPVDPTGLDVEYAFTAGRLAADGAGATWVAGTWAGTATHLADGTWQATATTADTQLAVGEWLAWARIGGAGGPVKFAGQLTIV